MQNIIHSLKKQIIGQGSNRNKCRHRLEYIERQRPLGVWRFKSCNRLIRSRVERCHRMACTWRQNRFRHGSESWPPFLACQCVHRLIIFWQCHSITSHRCRPVSSTRRSTGLHLFCFPEKAARLFQKRFGLSAKTIRRFRQNAESFSEAPFILSQRLRDSSSLKNLFHGNIRKILQ